LTLTEWILDVVYTLGFVNKNKNDLEEQRRIDSLNNTGTPEIKIGEYPNRIVNINDAFKMLTDKIKDPLFTRMNEENFEGMTEMGVLDIWVDEKKPMQYQGNSRRK
jgi:hypothetical protein